jgi:hypothetical protein
MGEDWERTLTIQNSDESLADLTGASAEMQVRNVAGGNLLLTAVCTVDENASQITLTIGRSDTASADTTGLRLRSITEYIDTDGSEFKADGYCAVYAIELTYGDGQVENILRGTFALVPEVVE